MLTIEFYVSQNIPIYLVGLNANLPSSTIIHGVSFESCFTVDAISDKGTQKMKEIFMLLVSKHVEAKEQNPDLRIDDGNTVLIKKQTNEASAQCASVRPGTSSPSHFFIPNATVRRGSKESR